MKSLTLICSRGRTIRREFVKGSIEVYPVRTMLLSKRRIICFLIQIMDKAKSCLIIISSSAYGVWEIARINSYGCDVMNNY